MTVSRTLPLLAALASLAGACGHANERSAAGHTALVSRGSGVWEAEFRLAHTPRGPAPTPAPVVRGTVALLETRDGVGREWLRRAGTYTGVYDVAFRLFGLIPEGAGSVPTLVAAVVPADSLVIATPSSTEGGSLLLQGTIANATGSAAGPWSYGTRAVGGWGGTLSLRARPSSPR